MMKLTKRQLRKIIKEEISSIAIAEGLYDPPSKEDQVWEDAKLYVDKFLYPAISAMTRDEERHYGLDPDEAEEVIEFVVQKLLKSGDLDE